MGRKAQSIREAYHRLLPYLSRYRRQAVWIVLLGAVAAIGSKVNVALLYPLVSLLFPGESDETPLTAFTQDWVLPLLQELQLFGWSAEVSTVVILVVFMLVAAAVFAVIQFSFVRLSRMLGVWLVTDLRQDMAEHILKLGMRYHSERRLGDLISRMTADVATSLRILNLIVEELIQEPFNIMASLIVAYAAAPNATLAMLIFMPILALPVVKLGPKVRRRSAKSLAKLGDTTQTLAQMFSGIRVVKAFRMESQEAEGFKAANQEFVRQTERMVKAQATGLSITAFLAQGGVAAVIGAVTLLSLLDRPVFGGAGSMVTFFVAIAGVYAGVKRLTKALSIIFTSMGATERVFEVLDLEPEIVSAPDARPFPGLRDSIRLEGVHFHYEESDESAIDGIDLTIARGERIALVGPSGAGKTTLLDLVARFYDPSRGKITIDGIDLRQLALDDWLDRLALVSQQPFLFQTTLLENVRYGRLDASEEEVMAACRAAHLEDFLDNLPDGLATHVGEAGARLSGGQAQRVTIARAILRNPDLLLLDEATSALDSQSERKVQEALEVLMSNRTSLIIAHRLSTIRNCDRILVLERGRIVEQGRHEDLVAFDGLYARMWRLQVSESVVES